MVGTRPTGTPRRFHSIASRCIAATEVTIRMSQITSVKHGVEFAIGLTKALQFNRSTRRQRRRRHLNWFGATVDAHLHSFASVLAVVSSFSVGLWLSCFAGKSSLSFGPLAATSRCTTSNQSPMTKFIFPILVAGSLAQSALFAQTDPGKPLPEKPD